MHRTFTNRKGDELHHSGWNACSSCYYVDESSKTVPKRDRLVLPSLNSDFIYILDVVTDPRKPEIVKTIDGDVLKSHNVTAPHTTHCLANGNIMISVMGDAEDMPRVTLSSSIRTSIASVLGPRAIRRHCADTISGISHISMSWFLRNGELPINGDG